VGTGKEHANPMPSFHQGLHHFLGFETLGINACNVLVDKKNLHRRSLIGGRPANSAPIIRRLIGIGAGALPRFKNKLPQLLTLCAYAIVASFVYGGLMTLWNWPFLAGTDSSVSYEAGAGLGPNLLRFLNYEIVTGGLLWDAGRAITTCVLILLTAPALLATLKRAANRAGFEG
jgi:hypothetical protein